MSPEDLNPTDTAVRRPRTLRAFAVLAVACAGTAFAASCASVPDNTRLTIFVAEDGGSLEPDYATYKEYVNNTLERQCGTFDCHGQPGRAYRVYSYLGLRVFNPEAGLQSGVSDRTETEVRYNFQSLISIQPEEMRRVMARGGDNPDVLIFLSKPLGNERHKGGSVIVRNGPAYKCITGWLRTPVGGKLDRDSQQSCKLAEEAK
jgi:hypothetical protein